MRRATLGAHASCVLLRGCKPPGRARILRALAGRSPHPGRARILRALHFAWQPREDQQNPRTLNTSLGAHASCVLFTSHCNRKRTNKTQGPSILPTPGRARILRALHFALQARKDQQNPRTLNTSNPWARTHPACSSSRPSTRKRTNKTQGPSILPWARTHPACSSLRIATAKGPAKPKETYYSKQEMHAGSVRAQGGYTPAYARWKRARPGGLHPLKSTLEACAPRGGYTPQCTLEACAPRGVTPPPMHAGSRARPGVANS